MAKSYTRENRPPGVSKREWDKARKAEGRDPYAKFFSDPVAERKAAQRKLQLSQQQKKQADDFLESLRQTTFQDRGGNLMSMAPEKAQQLGYESPYAPRNPLTGFSTAPKQGFQEMVSQAPKATPLSDEEKQQADSFLKTLGRGIATPFVKGALSVGEMLRPSNIFRSPVSEAPKPKEWSVNVLGQKVSSVQKSGQDREDAYRRGEITREQLLGGALTDALDIASIAPIGKAMSIVKGAYKTAGKEITEQTLKSAIKSGAKYGATYGGAYGAAGAMEEKKSALEGGITGAATGALGGGVLGVGAYGLGKGLSKIFGKKPEIKQPVKETIAPKEPALKVIPAKVRSQEGITPLIPLIQEGVRTKVATEMAQDRITALSKQSTEELSRKVAKDPQVFQKDISYLEASTKTKKGQVNPFINTKNLDISDDSKKFIDKTIEEIKPQIEESLGSKLTNQEVVDFADKTSQTLNRVIGREQTKNFEAALLNTRRKLATMSESGIVDKEYLETLKTVKTLGTDIARKLQSFSIEAGTTDLSKQKILEAVLKVNDNTDEILKAAKGIDFTDANQATEFYRTFIKPTTGEWVDLLRYNSMLSSPTTHIINTFSNTVNSGIIAPIEKTLTGTLDFIGGLVGKKRKYFAGEGASYFSAYVKNLGEASQRFSDVLTGKKAATNLDLKYVPIATKGAKGAVVKTLSIPTRLLEASDQFFTSLSEAGEKASLALRKSKGVSVGNIESLAKEKAAYRVFRQDLFDKNQGHLLDAIDQITSKIMGLRNNKNPIVSTISKFTVPFVKTPMNIFKQGLEYSPAGFATAFGSKNKVEQISKAIIGSTVFAGASSLLASDRLTWGEPTSEKQRQEWRQAGVQPYSVKLGNKWYSYQKLVPSLSFPISIVAAIDDAQKNKKLDDSTTELILSSVAKYGEFLADQSYVKSIGDLLSAAKGGEAGIARVIGNYPQQLVPFRALGGWLARLTDDVQRKVDNKADFIDKQVQLLMMNIPVLSKNVPARLDIEGKPIPTTNNILNAFSPIKVSTENEKFKDILIESSKKRKEVSEKKIEIEKAKEKLSETGEYQKVGDTYYYLEDKKIKHTTSEDIIKGKPIYEKVQSLVKEGKLDEARAAMPKTAEDRKAYEAAKKSAKLKSTAELKIKHREKIDKMVELYKANKIDQVREIMNTIPEEERLSVGVAMRNKAKQ